MYRFREKCKRPKLLTRLIWRWVLISASVSSSCEQSISIKPPQNPIPRGNALDFPRHQLSSVTTSTGDYNTSFVSAVKPNKSVRQSGLPPVWLLAKSSGVQTHTNSSETAKESNDPVSCYGRCGDRKSFPCSCTGICMINGNCCSDIKRECPSLIHSVLSQFKHLKDAAVECSRKTSTFMIMSCPNPSSAREKEALEMESVTKDRAKLVTQPSISKISVSEGSEQKNLSSNAFLSLILDSPITDTTTGLVYRNRSVARCNGVLDLDTLPWLVQVETSPAHGGAKDIGSLNELVSTETVVYSPPDSVKLTHLGSACIPHSKRECQKASLTGRPNLESMCLNGGITYYMYISKSHEYFDNIHCLVCNEGSENDSSPVLNFSPNAGKKFRFSLVASLASSGSLILRAATGKTYMSWATVECSVSAEEQGGGKCDTSQCGERYERRPDGECRR
ncbi:hypothetical protein ElyMa_002052000, partial [Elysia marginata]